MSNHPQLSRAERAVLEERYRRQRHDARFTLILAGLSLSSLLYYYANQQLLLYGDAVAHINIARRVMDNRHPLQSFIQLGTVWLPLQHIAMLPFVWNNALWRSGIAGAIPGMVAYILGGLGTFRLVSSRATSPIAYFAAAIYALNPNLLYLQTTAMNEPIFLAFFLWSLVYLGEFLRGISPPGPDSAVGPSLMRPERALEACGICIAGGVFTRYDGWFVGAILGLIVLGLFARWWRRTPDPQSRRSMRKSLAEFLLLNALIPIFWLVYTRNVSGRAFDFMNGPYSAKAIALRTTAAGAPPYPGQQHPVVAALYFLRSAMLNVGEAYWGYILFFLALLGTAWAARRFRSYGILLLLWLPLLFYTLSIAYGSVPIFLPVWYPYSYYNARYGLELLPACAVFVALLAGSAAQSLRIGNARVAIWCALGAIVAASYGYVWRSGPVTLREAEVNSRSRIFLEEPLAEHLAGLPATSTLLMYEGDHVGALQRAGIPLRRVISEGTHPEWEWATIDPSRQADYVVACQGDPMATAVWQHPTELTQLISISVPGKPECAIYQSRRP